MARYVARVHTPMPVTEAFALMADMRTYATWDPGLTRSVQVVGEGPGVGSTYDLQLALPPLVTLRYVTQEYHVPAATSEPHEVLHVATNVLFSSTDRITVRSAPGGSLVVYDADLRLTGPLRLGDPGLRLVFGWVAGRAESGMRTALSGTSVPA
jgi:hypothetical protein